MFVTCFFNFCMSSLATVSPRSLVAKSLKGSPSGKLRALFRQKHLQLDCVVIPGVAGHLGPFFEGEGGMDAEEVG